VNPSSSKKRTRSEAIKESDIYQDCLNFVNQVLKSHWNLMDEISIKILLELLINIFDLDK
jgi:hypothetical protein